MALIRGDTLPEADETFRLRVVSGPVVPVAESFLVTIANDDYPMLLVYPPRPREGDSGSTGARVALALHTPAPFRTGVAFRLEGAEAEPGVDFQAGEGWLVFEPGSTTADFEVAIFGDPGFETDENLRILLGSPEGLVLPGHIPTVTILNDDFPPAPTARILPSSPGAGFRISFESVAGVRYRLSYATHFDQQSWIPVEPVVVGDGSVLSLHVDDSPDETRYFRLSVE